MRGDDLRDVFGAVHDADDPDLGFDVADVVRAGARVRRGRRTAAAVGSGLATVAAAVVALVLLPGGRSPDPVEPAGPTVSRTTTVPVPSPVPASPAGVPSSGAPLEAPSVAVPDVPPSASAGEPRADPAS
ncbi:hypothetical protein [Umezawaea sp. NPDC059074]|uniref:hypothetical protein n=1 Tax=Umezawaea sp. NPDC059074 TaxID=3346716 RepID=UPI0036C9635C